MTPDPAGPPPYAAVLRQQPQQERSRRRVEQILGAAAELLADHEPEELTVRAITERAGVPTGTLYQFFPDLDAVLQAVALRYLSETPAVLEAALQQPGGWEALLDHTVDAYVAMVRSAPAIRRLWLGGVLDAATRTVERDADAMLAEALGGELQRRAGSDHGSPHQWRLVVALVNASLVQGFTEDEAGDERTLAAGKAALRAYVRTVLAGG